MLPRFVKYKEGAKLTYDQLRFVFAATVTLTARSRVCFWFFTKVLFKRTEFHHEMIRRPLFCFKDTNKYKLINIELFETKEINY